MRPAIRVLLLVPLALAAGCYGAAVKPSEAGIETPKERLVEFDATEFTESNIDVSPDGREFVFDVLGNIYVADLSGYAPTQITKGDSWNYRASYSPDGSKVAFLSDRGGKTAVWVGTNDGQNLSEYPAVSTNSFGWSRSGEVTAAEHFKASSVVSGWTNPTQRRELLHVSSALRSAAFGAWSPDGQYVYYGGDSIYRMKLDGSARKRVLPDATIPKAEYFSLKLSMNGEVLAFYSREMRGSDPSMATYVCTLHAMRMSSGTTYELEKSERSCNITNYPNYGIPGYGMSPDGSFILANHNGKLAKFDIVSGKRTDLNVSVPIMRRVAPVVLERKFDAGPSGFSTKIVRWPQLTQDGRTLVFGALSAIYKRDVRTGETHRLTGKDVYEYSPSLSPDGKWIAFSRWSDEDLGHIFVASLDGKVFRQITRKAGRYINPRWSPDGKTVVYISDVDPRGRDGLHPKSVSGDNYPSPGSIRLELAQVDGKSTPVPLMSVIPLHWQIRRFYPVPTILSNNTDIAVAVSASGSRGNTNRQIVTIGIGEIDPAVGTRIPSVDEAVVSTDGKKIAAVRQGRLYVWSSETLDPKIEQESVEGGEIKIDVVDPVYVSWVSENSLVWAEGTSVYRYNLGEKSKILIADIDIRQSRNTSSACVALVGARLITLSHGNTIENGFITVCGDKIAGIGDMSQADIPDNVPRIDVRGKTIMPGIIEPHAHIATKPQREIVPLQESGFVSFLAYGITTAYDPRTDTLDALVRSEMLEANLAIGPRLFTAGEGVKGNEAEPDPAESFSHLRPRIRDMNDARAVVIAKSRYGAGPIKSYSDNRRDRRRLLAAAALEAGTSVTQHAASYEDALASVLDGISIEHSLTLTRDMDLYSDVLTFLAMSGVSYTVDMIGNGDYEFDVDDEKLNRFMPNVALQAMHSQGDFLYPKRRRARQAEDLARLSDLKGYPLVSAHGSSVPGLATHHDIWALVDSGKLSPYEALVIACVNSARKIGMAEHLGSLERGKLADLLILNSNPLDSIHNTIDIRYVMKGGLLYDASSMDRVWPSFVPLKPWRWVGLETSAKTKGSVSDPSHVH